MHICGPLTPIVTEFIYKYNVSCKLNEYFIVWNIRINFLSFYCKTLLLIVHNVWIFFFTSNVLAVFRGWCKTGPPLPLPNYRSQNRSSRLFSLLNGNILLILLDQFTWLKIYISWNFLLCQWLLTGDITEDMTPDGVPHTRSPHSEHPQCFLTKSF